MFLHVAEVMGRHYGIVPIQVRHPFLDSSPRPRYPQLLVSRPILFQHLDLLVRDSSHFNKAGQGHVSDVIQVSIQREGMEGQVDRAELRGPVGKLGTGLDPQLRALPFHLSEIQQIPQGSGAAPKEASPLLPPACSKEAVGQQRPRKPRQ